MDDLVKKAQFFAKKWHGDQTYGAGVPYVTHLEHVVSVLERFGVVDPEVLAAAYIHDSIEDTLATAFDVWTHFGPRVLALVHAVTNAEGKNRKERHLKTYPKIRATPGATQLKLADRIANVEYSLWNESKELDMYRNEYFDFKTALRVSGKYDSMWAHLDILLLMFTKRNEDVS